MEFAKKNNNTFTHFLSLPLIEPSLKSKLQALQSKIYEFFSPDEQKLLNLNNPNLFHITLSMLTLPKESHQKEAEEILKKNQEKINEILKNTKLKIKLGKVNSFFNKPEGVAQVKGHKYMKNKDYKNIQNKRQDVIYLEVLDDDNLRKVKAISHILIKDFIEKEIIDTSDLKTMKLLYDHREGCFRAEKYHITLFRCDGSLDLRKVMKEFESFEFGEAECGFLDISTRFLYDDEKFYKPLFRLLFE